jgi:hypothetical protein
MVDALASGASDLLVMEVQVLSSAPIIECLLTNNSITNIIKSMKTVSYSLDEETAEGIKEIARKSKVSSSDVVRSMYYRMELENTLESMRLQAVPLLERLGLNTEDDVVAYANSKA